MKTKKIVALLLSLAVMLASFSLLCVSASAVEVQTQIDIPDEQNTYELNGVTYTVIRSADEMNAAATAEENASGGVNYILDADLVYSEETPYEQIHLANGSLNGNGHSITGVNLALGKDDGNNIAMFKVSNDSTVTVSNLTVGAPGNPVSVTCTDSSWTADGSCRIGTLFGYLQATATFENVTVYSNVSAVGNFRAGGFIAEARNALTMKNCVFNGSVVAGDANTGNETKCAAGGLVGHSCKATMNLENCATFGNISYTNGYAGGLFGVAERYTTFTNCANYANVNGVWSGGLIGDAGATVYTQITMGNCFNAGKVTGTDGAAGLIYQCVRRNDFPTDLENCANIGEVVGVNKADLIYSYATADASKLTVKNCGSFGAVGALAISTKTAENTTIIDTTTDAAAALTFMQTNFGYAMFAVENNQIVVKFPAEAKFLQYRKDAEAGEMDIRVLGVINATDLTKYANVGFYVSVYDASGETPTLLKDFGPQTTTVVYESVNANEGGTINSYSAEALGAEYLYALELRGIPTTGSYIFEITAFATEGGMIVCDSVVSVTVNGGVIGGDVATENQ